MTTPAARKMHGKAQGRAIPATPMSSNDDSVTVAVAARRLGCDPTTVRALLIHRQLAGHRVGKGQDPRGVRVHMASIHDYIFRHAIGGEAVNDNVEVSAKVRLRPTAVHNDAMAKLRAMGIAVKRPS